MMPSTTFFLLVLWITTTSIQWIISSCVNSRLKLSSQDSIPISIKSSSASKLKLHQGVHQKLQFDQFQVFLFLSFRELLIAVTIPPCRHHNCWPISAAVQRFDWTRFGGTFSPHRNKGSSDKNNRYYTLNKINTFTLRDLKHQTRFALLLLLLLQLLLPHHVSALEII